MYPYIEYPYSEVSLYPYFPPCYEREEGRGAKDRVLRIDNGDYNTLIFGIQDEQQRRVILVAAPTSYAKK
jgi:hypothetical protein